MHSQYQGAYDSESFQVYKNRLSLRLCFKTSFIDAFLLRSLSGLFQLNRSSRMKNRIDRNFQDRNKSSDFGPVPSSGCRSGRFRKCSKIQHDAEISASLDSWKIYVRENVIHSGCFLIKAPPELCCQRNPGAGSRKVLQLSCLPLWALPLTGPSHSSAQFLASRENRLFSYSPVSCA
jgi:hypothetical protein